MIRDVEYDEDAICDDCGREGAYDFQGDFLCTTCAREYIDEGTDDGDDE